METWTIYLKYTIVKAELTKIYKLRNREVEGSWQVRKKVLIKLS